MASVLSCRIILIYELSVLRESYNNIFIRGEYLHISTRCLTWAAPPLLRLSSGLAQLRLRFAYPVNTYLLKSPNFNEGPERDPLHPARVRILSPTYLDSYPSLPILRKIKKCPHIEKFSTSYFSVIYVPYILCLRLILGLLILLSHLSPPSLIFSLIFSPISSPNSLTPLTSSKVLTGGV